MSPFPLEVWIAGNPRVRGPIALALVLALFFLGSFVAPIDSFN